MAAAHARLLRSRVSPRTISLLHGSKSVQSEASTSLPSSLSRSISSNWRSSLVSRLASVSMLPLHSAIASARLKSALAAESQHWGWVPQGISLPL